MVDINGVSSLAQYSDLVTFEMKEIAAWFEVRTLKSSGAACTRFVTRATVGFLRSGDLHRTTYRIEIRSFSDSVSNVDVFSLSPSPGVLQREHMRQCRLEPKRSIYQYLALRYGMHSLLPNA